MNSKKIQKKLQIIEIQVVNSVKKKHKLCATSVFCRSANITRKEKHKEFIKYGKNITHIVVSYFPVFPVVFTLWWQLWKSYVQFKPSLIANENLSHVDHQLKFSQICLFQLNFQFVVKSRTNILIGKIKKGNFKTSIRISQGNRNFQVQ